MVVLLVAPRAGARAGLWVDAWAASKVGPLVAALVVLMAGQWAHATAFLLVAKWAEPRASTWAVVWAATWVAMMAALMVVLMAGAKAAGRAVPWVV